MNSARERYLATAAGQEAVKRASAKQEAKRKAAVAWRRDQVERYRQALKGVAEREVRELVSLFKAELKEREAQERLEQLRERAERKQQNEQKRRQREELRLEARIQSERSRVNRLVESGAVGGMSGAERAEWIEQCRRVNPIMYDILKEKGIA